MKERQGRREAVRRSASIAEAGTRGWDPWLRAWDGEQVAFCRRILRGSPEGAQPQQDRDRGRHPVLRAAVPEVRLQVHGVVPGTQERAGQHAGLRGSGCRTGPVPRPTAHGGLAAPAYLPPGAGGSPSALVGDGSPPSTLRAPPEQMLLTFFQSRALWEPKDSSEFFLQENTNTQKLHTFLGGLFKHLSF